MPLSLLTVEAGEPVAWCLLSWDLTLAFAHHIHQMALPEHSESKKHTVRVTPEDAQEIPGNTSGRDSTWTTIFKGDTKSQRMKVSAQECKLNG